jgi:CHAD domain-containing protein
MSHNGASRDNGKTSLISDPLGEEVAPNLGPDEPAVHAIRLALLEGHQRLQRNDPAARQGDVEGVHRMRTAARRLRSDLSLFRDLLEGDWAERLSLELKWLGRQLGAVRDADVMRERLLKAAGELGNDLGPLFATLTEQHRSASAALRETFEGERYRKLLEQLSEAAADSLFRDEAWEPCGTTLPPLVQAAWRRLKRAGRALDLTDADENYHEVRKRAKHARYAGERVAPALDSDPANTARRFAKRAQAVQDVLGDHQDAIIACQEIRRIAADRPGDGPFNFAAGRLFERQEIAACDTRTRFFKAWHKLDREKNRGWMKA